jgi:hypothetical protein
VESPNLPNADGWIAFGGPNREACPYTNTEIIGIRLGGGIVHLDVDEVMSDPEDGVGARTSLWDWTGESVPSLDVVAYQIRPGTHIWQPWIGPTMPDHSPMCDDHPPHVTSILFADGRTETGQEAVNRNWANLTGGRGRSIVAYRQIGVVFGQGAPQEQAALTPTPKRKRAWVLAEDEDAPPAVQPIKPIRAKKAKKAKRARVGEPELIARLDEATRTLRNSANTKEHVEHALGVLRGAINFYRYQNKLNPTSMSVSSDTENMRLNLHYATRTPDYSRRNGNGS